MALVRVRCACRPICAFGCEEFVEQFADAVPKLEKAAPLDHYGNVHYQLYLAYKKLGQAELAQKAFARSQDLRRGSLERDQALIMGSPQVEPEPQ